MPKADRRMSTNRLRRDESLCRKATKSHAFYGHSSSSAHSKFSQPVPISRQDS